MRSMPSTQWIVESVRSLYSCIMSWKEVRTCPDFFRYFPDLKEDDFEPAMEQVHNHPLYEHVRNKETWTPFSLPLSPCDINAFRDRRSHGFLLPWFRVARFWQVIKHEQTENVIFDNMPEELSIVSCPLLEVITMKMPRVRV